MESYGIEIGSHNKKTMENDGKKPVVLSKSRRFGSLEAESDCRYPEVATWKRRKDRSIVAVTFLVGFSMGTPRGFSYLKFKISFGNLT